MTGNSPAAVVGIVAVAGAPAHVIRDWARLHGFQIEAGGPISAEVMRAYDDAIERRPALTRRPEPAHMDHLPPRSYHRNHPFH